MLTGPHSDECLESEWSKSGCTGNVQDRITDPQFFLIGMVMHILILVII